MQPFVMARLGLSVSNFVCCYYFCATLAFDDINIYIYIYALFKKLVLFAVKYVFVFFFLPIIVFCGTK